MDDDEIDEDALAAMLADDEQEEEEKKKKAEDRSSKLSFVEQADCLTPEQLVELTCTLVDEPPKKTPRYQLSDTDIGDLLGSSNPAAKKLSSTTPATLSSLSTQPTINPSVYLDPSTHIRIGTLNYTPEEIKTKLSATKCIRLSEIEKQPPPMPTEWCTMAVLASKSDVKQASNGSTFSIWRMTDFKTTLNMFLFGDAHQSLWKTTLSSVLLIYDSDTKKPGQLSIKNHRNVCILGVNPDLGQCKAKAKSGEQCKMIIDRHACEYCVTHAHQHYKTGQRNDNNNNKFQAGNASRMNLQSTGSFVPKKFASLGSSSVGSSWSSKPPSKKQSESSKASGHGLNDKEKSMLVMLGIEDDSLICVRTAESQCLDSISDLREIYQAKQAAGKKPRVVYDETRDRDRTSIAGQIRSYPYGASISPERKEDPSPEVPSPSQVKVTTKMKNSPKNFVDLNKAASTEAINSAKQRAIDILKQRLTHKQVTPNKNQSLVSADISSLSSKRPHTESSPDSDATSKRLKVSNNTTDTNDQERFNDIMNMKSSYADLYSQMTLDEMFERYKKKENIEEKLLQVMERDVKVVVCRQCHYTAYKQSVLCKQKQHFVKVSEVKQKFFECIECNKRVFTWSQYPVENCSKCHSLKGFRRTALIRERHGAKFDDEILVLRGEETKFLNGFANYEKLPNVVD